MSGREEDAGALCSQEVGRSGGRIPLLLEKSTIGPTVTVLFSSRCHDYRAKVIFVP